MTIETDACKTGWEAFANGLKIGGVWSSMEKTEHINILELKVIYLALMTFTKETKNNSPPERIYLP